MEIESSDNISLEGKFSGYHTILYYRFFFFFFFFLVFLLNSFGKNYQILHHYI